MCKRFLILIFFWRGAALFAQRGEFLIDTTTNYGAAAWEQTSPAIAFNGTNYLVVWEDMRTYSEGIFGTRVSGEGIVLDSAGILITTQGSSPAVASDGRNYFVVWEEGGDIYGTRVAPNGQILDPEGIPISTAFFLQKNPAVAFDGINYLVVWEDGRSGHFPAAIYGARVSPEGILLDPEGILITEGSGGNINPGVAFGERNYLVVWENRPFYENDIYGIRLNRDGVILDTAPIPISTEINWQKFPSLIFGDENFFVVWEDHRYLPRSGPDIFGARITEDGLLLDPEGIPITWGELSECAPHICYNPRYENYFVVWEDFRRTHGVFPDIYGTRLNKYGVVLDSAGMTIAIPPFEQHIPSVAWGDRNYLVVWEDWRNAFYHGNFLDIYGTVVTAEGIVLDTFGMPIATNNYEQYTPALAFNGRNYLLIWEDGRHGNYDIYGARIDTDGEILDPTGIPISTVSDVQHCPSLAFGNGSYFVVWGDWRNGPPNLSDIYGARVSSDGEVLDPEGIPIFRGVDIQTSPAVAFDGINYLVVWMSREGENNLIYGARVTQEGRVLDPNGFPIGGEFGEKYNPSVTFDGINYFVVWQERRNGDFDIYGARVTPEGIVLDPEGIPISRAGDDQGCPSVAFDGVNYLVVWEDRRNGEGYDIYGSRVDREGNVLDPHGFSISGAYHSQTYPKVTFDGTNYFVVWEDFRSGYEKDIYGAKVSPYGLVIDSFSVSLQPKNQCSPSLVKGFGNQLLIVYAGWVDSINCRPANTYRLWGKFYPFIGIKKNCYQFPNSHFFLKIYPNPTSSYFSISIPSDVDRVRIYDASGRLIKDKELKENEKDFRAVRIEIEEKEGIYFIKIGEKVGKLVVKR
ncbi:MAG: T9SS type A sorting domain-containing protein [candidate division WOR-3 bacterium]